MKNKRKSDWFYIFLKSKSKKMSIEELAKEYEVSEHTIKRWLGEAEERGITKKTFPSMLMRKEFYIYIVEERKKNISVKEISTETGYSESSVKKWLAIGSYIVDESYHNSCYQIAKAYAVNGGDSTAEEFGLSKNELNNILLAEKVLRNIQQEDFPCEADNEMPEIDNDSQDSICSEKSENTEYDLPGMSTEDSGPEKKSMEGMIDYKSGFDIVLKRGETTIKDLLFAAENAAEEEMVVCLYELGDKYLFGIACKNQVENPRNINETLLKEMSYGKITDNGLNLLLVGEK